MQLALKMGRTLEELGNSMSSDEFAMWLEVYPDDLWGEMRAYERSGLICATVANFAGKSLAKGAEAVSARDFMPVQDEAAEVEPDPVEYFRQVAAGRG